MSARTGKRRQAGLSRERLIALLAVIVITVAVAAIGLYANGSLTLDNLLVELGLKPPAAVVMDDIPDYSGQPYVVLEDNWPDFDAGDLTLEASSSL